MFIDPHSTRLFPKNLGADAYQVSGIAARCDWAVLSDKKPPQTHFRRLRATAAPRTIFLSLREPYAAIRYFCEQILPALSTPFVLLSGSEDATVPSQADRRWRPFDDHERRLIGALAQHPLLVHWFAENLDRDMGPKVSPLPLGLVFPDGAPAPAAVPQTGPFSQRQSRILCAHRVRNGPQWEPRRQVTRLAQTDWAAWCTVVEEEISEPEYLELVRQHAFVFCVEGGGLDPSPKAWQSILHGAIPVIRQSPVAAAYREFPVAIVADWSAPQITAGRLARWQQQLGPETEHGRSRILERLSGRFWWDQVAARAAQIPPAG